ncbi:rod shape-determining protein MreB [Sphingobium sp. TKS]|nr:rod shape-determining protein MreB [Sphingobium sp. TKS]
MGKPDFGIDFGTANTRIVTSGGGILFDEPSLCCFMGQADRGELVAAGSAVRSMLDRTSGAMMVARPLKRGVLSDIAAARDYLAYAVQSSVGQRRLRSFRAIIGVPADATNAERSALLTAANDAGLGSVQLLAEPLVAALGADLPIELPQGTMIVECGAGTTEAAILSLGGICATASLRGGGDALDGAISDHLHFRHKFLIGASTAEKAKRELVEMFHDGVDASVSIRIKGRNLANGLPGAISIPVSDLHPVVEKHVAGIAAMVLNLLSQIPPELSRDIHDGGIVLTGGSAEIGLVGRAIVDVTGLSVTVADNHAHCVARGLQRALAH